MSLSFCIIAKNEVNVIGGLLDSIKNVADEIVIGIDNRTTDGTDELVKSHGIDPFYFHWIDNFAWARNLTLERATGSHLFVIDADERLSQIGQQMMNVFKHQTGMPDLPVAFNVRNIKLNGELIKITPGPIRLTPNRADIRYRYVMHETLSYTEKCQYIPYEVIDHVGFDISLSKPGVRNLRNEHMLHERILQDFNDSDAWKYTAYWYRYVGMYVEAAICAGEALRLPSNFNPEEYTMLETIGSYNEQRKGYSGT